MYLRLSDLLSFSPGRAEQLCAERPTNCHTLEVLRGEQEVYPGLSPSLSPGLHLSHTPHCCAPRHDQAGTDVCGRYTQGEGYPPWYRRCISTMVHPAYTPGYASLLPYTPGYASLLPLYLRVCIPTVVYLSGCVYPPWYTSQGV